MVRIEFGASKLINQSVPPSQVVIWIEGAAGRGPAGRTKCATREGEGLALVNFIQRS